MFVFFSDGTQKAAGHQETIAETGQHEGFHSETPGRPLGAETRGSRAGGYLPEPEMMWLLKGAEMDRERESGGVLLPSSQVLQDSINLFLFAESLKERQQVQELCVIHIVKPGLDRDSVFRVENVRGRRIVNNDDVTELSSQPAEVFDIVPSVKNARFSEEPCSKHAPLVQQVCHRVCILGETGCKEHTFKELAHLLKELIHMGSLQNINLVNGTVDLHWNNEISIADGLE